MVILSFFSVTKNYKKKKKKKKGGMLIMTTCFGSAACL